MKGIDIFRQIEQIDDKYVAEAQMVRKRAWKNPRIYGSMAATACLLLCIGVYFQTIGNPKGSTEMLAADECYESGNAGMNAKSEFAMDNEIVEEMEFADEEAAEAEDSIAEALETDGLVAEVTGTKNAVTEDNIMIDVAVTGKLEKENRQELILEEAMAEADFGKYVKLDVPANFSNYSCYLTGKEEEKRLHILWDDGGMRHIQCDYSFMGEESNVTFFDSSEISLELIQKQAYQVQDAGDVEGDRMNFGICFENNILLRLNVKGVDSDKVYQMLLPIL